ncbi:NAD(P)(+)--arginine ADP-ribosyltransferase 1-like [Polyodon spathula]|uniref:NAD(P)(+)--arginine ADP-ribosyltransferase 1-like n=1 Tax=Polyodon spathula TaxID=7913 RepID=UPI001B7E7DC6|nr:NAD(P)(+)--arginine ADP-ribosyltransferase 1-like [Polyodon spathula]
MDLANSSLDDQYIGCEAQMLEKVKEENYLSTEIQKSPTFAYAWSVALGKISALTNFIGLSTEEATALYTYTMPDFHCEFNAAVRIGGGVNYNAFPFKALHFYMTTASKKLKAQSPSCVDVVRGSREPIKESVGSTVRFGTFTSSSLGRQVAESFGKETVFHIRTCQGVYIKDYSFAPHEEEVLIPPYEKFKVASVNGNEITLISVEGDTNSVNNCLAVPQDSSKKPAGGNKVGTFFKKLACC